MASRAVFAILLLLEVNLCAVSVHAQVDSPRLNSWVGVYPNDRVRGVTFLEDPEIKNRVIDALGPTSISQMREMSLVGPIVHRGDWLIAYGCQPDMCAAAKWWVAINFTNSEARACLALANLPTVRFGASGKKYVDLPRTREGGCPEPEKAIPVFDQLFRDSVGSATLKPPVASALVEPPPIVLDKSMTRVLLKKDGGTFGVPIEINGALTLDFIVDSGAADVSVPIDVFSTLLRTGTIQDSDIIGEQTYILADGSRSKSITFTIRSLKVGEKVVDNVRGSVGSSGGVLLLGQSFFERFKSWSVDNVNHELVLEPR